MNGLARNSSSDLPPKNNSREENILRLISSHLRAKLATTSSTPHTVPADLIKLFESLERKFDQDVNFRNSVLTWAIGKVEAIGMPPFSLLLTLLANIYHRERSINDTHIISTEHGQTDIAQGATNSR